MSSSEFEVLVEKYISEQSTPEEIELLRQKLSQPQYMAELDTIMDQQLASASGDDHDYSNVVERLKKRIFEKINEEEQAFSPVRGLSFFRRWMVAAAILIIIAGVSAYLFLSKRSSNKIASPDNATRQMDIAPGKDGAILTLDDGR